MRKKVIFITGAAGEVGQALIKRLSADNGNQILSFDLHPLPDELDGLSTHIVGDILDTRTLTRIVSQYELDTIYHLAALLSTRGEFTPDMAHRVNVDGTLLLLQLAADQSEWRRQPVKFIFPSSIAIYGMPQMEQSKGFFKRVREWEWNQPRTMYGCNKLYCELLGTYYSQHYRQLAAEQSTMVDFRSVRYPGLISAFTMPSGGTSDYAPEMIHAAAQGEPYACFVRPDTQIPFMAMPDAVDAILQLAEAPRENLNHAVYNVRGFSLTAGEIQNHVMQAFPGAEITTKIDAKRQGIVDSWPADLDDSAARNDWDWRPEYDAKRTFDDYLIPNITRRYAVTE
jgi:nucleoside-diphosphate-sugar epimerase